MPRVEHSLPHIERNPINEKIKISRGTVAPSKEYALNHGLDLQIDRGSFGSRRTPPPGLFFYTDEINTRVVDMATFYGRRESKLPVVIEIDITPENFTVLKGNIYLVNQQDRAHHSYKRLRSYRKLKRRYEREGGNGEVTVNLGGLSHENLTDLDIKVGFKEGDEEFVFKTYKEWSEELGVAKKPDSSAKRNRLFTGFRR